MTYYHLGELVHKQAHKNKSKIAIKQHDTGDNWSDITWGALSEKVMKTAQAMAELGVNPNDNIGIYSQNMSKYLIADLRHMPTKLLWFLCMLPHLQIR